jgi:hypothetical protein
MDELHKDVVKKCNEEYGKRKMALENEIEESKAAWLQRTEQRLLERYHERLTHSSNRLSLKCQQTIQKKEEELSDQLKEKANLRCRQLETQKAQLDIQLEQSRARLDEQGRKLADQEVILSTMRVELTAKNAEIDSLGEQLEAQVHRNGILANQLRELKLRLKQHSLSIIDRAVAGHSPASRRTFSNRVRELERPWKAALVPLEPEGKQSFSTQPLDESEEPSPPSITSPSRSDSRLDARLRILEKTIHLLVDNNQQQGGELLKRFVDLGVKPSSFSLDALRFCMLPPRGIKTKASQLSEYRNREVQPFSKVMHFSE